MPHPDRLPASQLTNAVLLVRPAAFGFNPETAGTNAFQCAIGAESRVAIATRAQEEFDVFVAQLRAAGLRVIVFQDPGAPATPDSLFPNNWVSFHPDGCAVLYPMHATNRRTERRTAVFEQLATHGHPYPTVVDLSGGEADEEFLEGTGSLVLDRARQVAYAALSPRTHHRAVLAWAARFGYEPVVFTATDALGTPIYHTNVLLSIGETVAVACFDAIANPIERAILRERLALDGRFVLAISHDQLRAFAGNMLQLRPAGKAPLLVLSAQAWTSIRTEQQIALRAHTQILTASLDTIERYGGGSARCMIAELF